MQQVGPNAAHYLESLAEFPHYLGNAWHESEPGRGYFGDPSHLEGGVRSMANVVFVSGLLVADEGYDALRSEPDRSWLLEKARFGLAYLTHGHVTGGGACADGAPWGGVWQSAWWTTRMALGAKLVWARLNEEERAAVKRVVVHEADLLLPRIVASGLVEDTKAEENAWDAEVLATAVAMFPEHPNRAMWWEKLSEFAFNTFSVAADRTDPRVVDGRPLRERVYTVNLYSDFTLENHGSYHFCYVASPLHSLAWASYALTSSGISPPEALRHHVAEVWSRAKPTFLRDRFAYVGGQDWARYTYGNYFIVPALVWLQEWLDDPDLQAIEQARFRCLRDEQRGNRDGSYFGRRFTEPFYQGQPAKYETDCYANMGLAYLLRRQQGQGDTSQPHPKSSGTSEAKRCDVLPLTGRCVSPESGIAFVRTPRLFASFSWKTLTTPLPMGLFIPVEREELAEWQPGNLFGQVHIHGETPSAVWIRRMREEGDGFRIGGTVIYRGRKGQILMTQELEYAVDAGQGLAKVRSRFVASVPLKVTRVEGLRLAIANDRWNDFKLDLHHDGGTVPVRFDPDAAPFWLRRRNLPSRVIRKLLRESFRDGVRRTLNSRWVNIDGVFGVIAEGESPTFDLYQPAGRNLPDGSLHVDWLYCPLLLRSRQYQADEVILDSAFTLLLGNADATRAAAVALAGETIP